MFLLVVVEWCEEEVSRRSTIRERYDQVMPAKCSKEDQLCQEQSPAASISPPPQTPHDSGIPFYEHIILCAFCKEG